MNDPANPVADLTASADVFDPKPETAPFIDAWYERGSGKLWTVANAIAAPAAAVAVSGHGAPGAIIAWLVFVTLNAVCYPVLLSALRRDGRRAAAAQLGLALIFGVSWGVLFLLVAPAVPPQNLVAMGIIGLFVAVTAIAVFAVQRGAYPLFIVPFVAAATPALNANAAIDSAVAWSLGMLVTLSVIASVYGRYSRTVLHALGNFSAIAGTDRTATATDAGLLFELQTRGLKRLRRERDRSRATLGAISEAVITATDNGLVDYMNPVAEVLTGIAFRDANGQPLANVVRLTTNSTHATLDILLARAERGETMENRGERARLERHDGLEYEIEYRISALPEDNGRPAGTICLLRDITAQRHLMEKAAWFATHDPLTNLVGRREFEQRLSHSLAAPAQTRQSMCYIDLDQFRYLTDAYGIEGANHALTAVAELLRHKVRSEDVLARIGEDRFGILLTDCTVDKARLIAAALKDAIEALPITWCNEPLSLTASIGAVEVGAPGDDMNRVFARAKSACGRAKAGGGNDVQVIDAEDQAERFRLVSRRRLLEIQAAVTAGQLELYHHDFLPLRPRDDGRACELLVRMPDPDREFLLPREFLVTEDHLALLPHIDRWVVRAATDALRDNNAVLAAMDTVFVTISGQSINDDRFLKFIVDTVSDEANRSKLCFKIAEAGSIREVERARYFVARLNALGCRIALDNFGVGIGSFALLKRLQIDFLKINTETVTNMAHSSVDYEIVLATSRIAKALGVETVAEGVTTHATRQALFGLGVDYVQGLLSGRPAPIAARDEDMAPSG